MKITLCTIGLFFLAITAGATPVTWVLDGVTLSDGGIATGTFTFDPAAGAACGSSSPCGLYSNVLIQTTTGSSRTGVTYSFVCGQDVTACTGVTPDSTELMLLSTNSPNQSGNPALALFFTGIGALPPNGLTGGGGTLDIGNSSGSVGSVDEGTCSNAACSSPGNPIRFSTAGNVTSVPEPVTCVLFIIGLAATIATRRSIVS